MSRRCDIMGKGVMTGHNVSHAINKTKRRFIPNLQRAKVSSDILGCSFQMRVCVHALRTIDVKGGLDAFLLGASDRKLAPPALRLKQRIQARRAVAQESPAP